MKRISFDADSARRLDAKLVEGATVAPLTAPIAAGSAFQAAVFRLEAGGAIVRHAAAVPQLLAVLEGEGEVAGGDGVSVHVRSGDAVFWDKGEEHETSSVDGMTVLIIEGDGLIPHG